MYFIIDAKWIEKCPPGYGWEMADKLVFLVNDPTVSQQTERLTMHLKDFVKTSSRGFVSFYNNKLKIGILSLKLLVEYLAKVCGFTLFYGLFSKLKSYTMHISSKPFLFSQLEPNNFLGR